MFKRVVLVAGVKRRISQRLALKMHKDKALEAMFKQLGSLDEKGTYTVINPNTLSRVQLKKVIRSFMFLSEKYNPNGEVTELKARLVTMGSE